MDYLKEYAQVAKMPSVISESLTLPFVMWLVDNGFRPSCKKNKLVFKHSDEIAVLTLTNRDLHHLNPVCQKWFVKFSRVWLKQGESFVNNLKMRGAFQFRSHAYLMMAA